MSKNKILVNRVCSVTACSFTTLKSLAIHSKSVSSNFLFIFGKRLKYISVLLLLVLALKKTDWRVKMAVNAQHLITLSIGKIAGSRTQRGGICLRKNLLVASVLSSARAYYYEEMCNRMQEHTSDVEEDYDVSSTSNVPSEWDREDMENSCEQEGTVTDTTPCDQTPPQEASCGQCNVNGVDKENEPEQSIEFAELKSVEMESCVPVVETESSQQRQILSDCTTFDQNTDKSSKRKRSEIEEACDSIIPKRAKVECDFVSKPSNTKEHVIKTESSISSLVSIFRSGLQGLSGDVNSPSVPSNHYPVSRSAFAQAPISIAAC